MPLTNQTLLAIKTNVNEIWWGDVCTYQPAIVILSVSGAWDISGPWSQPYTF